MDIAKLCRLCCNENTELVSLLENNGTLYMKSLISVEVHNTDNLPKNSCLECWNNLKNAYSIQQKFLEADEIIKQRFMNVLEIDDSEPPKSIIEQETYTSKNITRLVNTNRETRIKAKFVCTVCGRCYRYQTTLNKHCQLTHKSNTNIDNVQEDILDVCGQDSNSSFFTGTITDKEKPLKVYSCSICKKTFKLQKLLCSHKENHVKKECQVCHKLVGKYNFKSHMKIHSDNPQKCKLCKITLKNERTLKCHVKNVHNINTNSTNTKQICYICGKRLKCERILIKHLKNVHKINDKKTGITLEVVYKCSECNKHFTERPKYLAHVNNHRKKECPICKQNISRFNFTKHVRLHTEGPKTCHLCNTTCKNSESLRGHLNYTHSRKEYKCDICNKGFKKSYDRQFHIKRDHTGERNHICDHCGKCFITLFQMRNHIRVHHTDSKLYTCSICERSFSNMKALLQHERHHLGEHSYTCDICLETFSKKNSLRSHKYSRHNVIESQKCECARCNKIFSSEFALKNHVNKTHSEI